MNAEQGFVSDSWRIRISQYFFDVIQRFLFLAMGQVSMIRVIRNSLNEMYRMRVLSVCKERKRQRRGRRRKEQKNGKNFFGKIKKKWIIEAYDDRSIDYVYYRWRGWCGRCKTLRTGYPCAAKNNFSPQFLRLSWVSAIGTCVVE